MKFNEMGIPAYFLKGLQNQNITTPTEIQTLAIPVITEGRDLVATSETGSGKTYAFGIPAIDKVDAKIDGVQVLIVCPTRELAVQVNDELKKLAQYKEDCRLVPIFGGSNLDRQRVALKTAKIVVGTPGRIMDHLRRKTLKLNNIKMLVLDEADEMLNMGFREDIETILESTNDDRQTVMFSATMPKEILNITKNYMRNPLRVSSSKQDKAQDFINQFYTQVERPQKNIALMKLIQTYKPKISIIFCNTKRMVEELTNVLNSHGIPATGIHGDMRQNERKRAVDSIKRSNEGILIATDVIARGIDINNVDIVFNYDLPNQTEYYIHRIGRTARAGKTGAAYTIINTKNQLQELKELEKLTKNTIVKVSLDLTTGEFVSEPKSAKKDFSDNENSNNSREYKPRERSFGNNRSRSDRPRTEGSREYKPRERSFSSDRPRTEKSFGDKPREFKPRTEGSREYKPRERSFSSDRPRTERTFGDRPTFGDKPREFKPRTEGSREYKPRERSFSSDRPRTEKSFGDKPRSERTFGDKPREFKPRTEGSREYKPRERSFSSDRPRTERTFGDRPTFGDKPREFKPRTEGSREYKPRERSFSSDRPRTEKSFGDKPKSFNTEGSAYLNNREMNNKRRSSDSSRPAFGGKDTSKESGFSSYKGKSNDFKPSTSSSRKPKKTGFDSFMKPKPVSMDIAREDRKKSSTKSFGARKFGKK